MTPKVVATKRSPWIWVPSLYFGEGLPYVAVMTISVILYKRFGMSNTDIAFYTAWLYLPWTIKFLWSPFVDILKSKRWWIVLMQLLIGAFLGGVAFSLPTPFWFQASLAFFWLMAFSSATHDIAADGFYMHGLETRQQAFFIGIRNTFYRLAMITGQGLIIILAGKIEQRPGNPFGMEQIPYAWMLVFLIMAVFFVLLSMYHAFVLPRPQTDLERKSLSYKQLWQDLLTSFKSFFQKKHILSAIAFMLLYRFSEAQLVKIASPFLLDSTEVGGLGLNTAQVGFAYGTLGIVCLVIGGILGGIVISKKGLAASLWPMVFMLCLPNLVYVYFAFARPESLTVINLGIALEQLGYGYGFTAYTMYLLHFSQGPFKTAHYAICTAFMALGMMIPGMFAGALQEWLGYPLFFVWIVLATLPCFWVVGLVKKHLKE